MQVKQYFRRFGEIEKVSLIYVSSLVETFILLKHIFYFLYEKQCLVDNLHNRNMAEILLTCIYHLSVMQFLLGRR